MKITFFSKVKRIKQLENEVEKWKKISEMERDITKSAKEAFSDLLEMKNSEFHRLTECLHESTNQFIELTDILRRYKSENKTLKKQLNELKYEKLRNKKTFTKKASRVTL